VIFSLAKHRCLQTPVFVGEKIARYYQSISLPFSNKFEFSATPILSSSQPSAHRVKKRKTDHGSEVTLEDPQTETLGHKKEGDLFSILNQNAVDELSFGVMIEAHSPDQEASFSYSSPSTQSSGST